MKNETPTIKPQSLIAMISGIRDKAYGFITKKLEEHGITGIVPSHGAILANLYNYGPMPMKELARRIQRKKNTLTILVNKLIKYGYIVKNAVPGDRRVGMISLTEKAMKIREDFDQISNELIAKAYENISEEEKIHLMTLLEKIDKNFSYSVL